MSNIDWPAVHAKLPMERNAEQKSQRLQMFKQFDPNGNGYLSLAEVDKGIRDVLQLDGVFDAKPVIIRAFTAAKKLNDKRGRSSRGPDYVEKCEFRMLLVYLRQYFEIWQMFDKVDKGDDRRINLEEFTNATHLIAKWGVKVDNPETAFSEIDQNGGGQVLFDEFAEWALEMSLDLVEDGSDDENDAEHMQAAELAPLPPPKVVEEETAPVAEEEEAGAEQQQEEEQAGEEATAPVEEEQQPVAEELAAVAAVEEEAAPAAEEEQQQPVAAPQEAEAPPHQVVEEEQEVADQQQVAQGDVVAEFDGHYFSNADVEDIIKLQAVYRRQEAKKRAAQRKADRDAKIKAQRSVPIEPITMPEIPSATAAADESNKSGAADQQGNNNNRLGNVDYSKVNVETMSADTKGMQTMYTRMLKSKMWW